MWPRGVTDLVSLYFIALQCDCLMSYLGLIVVINQYFVERRLSFYNQQALASVWLSPGGAITIKVLFDYARL